MSDITEFTVISCFMCGSCGLLTVKSQNVVELHNCVFAGSCSVHFTVIYCDYCVKGTVDSLKPEVLSG